MSKVVCLVPWFQERTTACTRCAGPLESGRSPTMYSTFRLGVERRRHLCAGTWRPPPFLVKLLSGKRDQVDRDCILGRDLIARSNTLCECFSNVDVVVPLWLTEPRDKIFVSRVCFISSRLYISAFHTSKLCVTLLS